MICPLCSSPSKRAFEIFGFEILDCAVCGHRFAGISAGESHVAANYDDGYFTDGGAGYDDYTAEANLLIKRGKVYAKIVSRFTDPGRILDIGCAAGYILKGFSESGWSGVGLEPNRSMAEIGVKEFGLEIHQGAFETFQSESKFDLISMIQVAGHFYDPKAAFEKSRELLGGRGFLLIETWDRGSISARLFGRRWHEYSPPTVLNWFSRSGLSAFLDGMGFDSVATGRPSKKISGGHVRSLLKFRLGDSPLLKLIPESINFPYPSEDLFWALFRKR